MKQLPKSPRSTQKAATSKPQRAYKTEQAAREKRRPEVNSTHNASQQPIRSEKAQAHDKLARISGLSAVSALFKQEPQRVMRLYYEERMKQTAGAWCAQLAKSHRPYRCVEPDELARIAGTALHGGIVAAALPRDVEDLNFALAESWAKRGEHLFILDGVGNPHNLGAVARSLAFFGIRHLALSDHPEQAGLSDAAYRVAEGGLEEMTVNRIPHLTDALSKLRRYYHVVGTAIGRKTIPVSALQPDNRPLALLLGNEEHGLPQATQNACETLLTIPSLGNMQSLNVAATAAVLAYELTREPSGMR